MKPSDYKGIELWGKQLGSFPYYIEGQQSMAARDGAPIDALYAKHSFDDEAPAQWVCVSDLKEDHPFRDAYTAYTKGTKNREKP